MASITMPKTEYERLKRQAKAYQAFAARFFETALDDSIEDVVADFRDTRLYSPSFLNDLKSGLEKSSYRSRKRNGAKAA